MSRRLKPTWQRASRKRASTAAVLTAEAEPLDGPPELPEGQWSKQTRAWWALVWSRPLAAVYLRSDLPALHMLASLVERYEHEPSPGLLREITSLEREFGLTPKSRRMLELEHFRETSEPGS